jgi:hypothetical protein
MEVSNGREPKKHENGRSTGLLVWPMGEFHNREGSRGKTATRKGKKAMYATRLAMTACYLTAIK